MHGWTSRQRNAAIASFLSWTLDAFDFFLLVFLLSDIAHSFHVDLEEVTLAILLTLAVRPVGALIFGRAAAVRRGARRAGAFFRPRLERFLPAQGGELMSNALKRQRGFSLPETVLAMALMVLTVTALGGYQRGMAQGIVQLNQTRQLWRDAWRYSQLSAPPSPARGQVSRMQTSRQRCVSITVTISRPVAKRVQMTRLHCPVSQ